MSALNPQVLLNKLNLKGTIWLVSDIHLSGHLPQTCAAFLRFLDQAAQHSQHLFLLGDIFEVWIGDDIALESPPAWLQALLDGLHCAAQHTTIYLMHGNRDFLMGPALAHRIGAQLLPDVMRLQTAQGCILISHGDEYCTADHAYQRFRWAVRQRWIRQAFLSLPRRLRQKIADQARKRSQRSNQYKKNNIMDVEPATIEQAFKHSDCKIMVHGHTHRPAIHHYHFNNQLYQRIVLPDWDYDNNPTPRGGWLVIDEQGLKLKQDIF